MLLSRVSNYSGARRNRPTIVGTGLVALDVLQGVTECETSLGGSAGNVLAILGHLGWHCVPVAQLGADAAAERISKEFAGLGADTRFLRKDSNSCTPVIFQLPGRGASTHEFSFYCPVCGRKRGYAPPRHDADIAGLLDAVETPDVFFFDRVTPWALELAERFSKSQTIIVFEPSTIGGDKVAFERALKNVDVLKYADDRISDMAQFDCSGIELEICTNGSKGLKFRSSSFPGKWNHLEAYDVPFISDTAGAGDWCTSGFLYGLIGEIFEKGAIPSVCGIWESLRIGQALAALNCMARGARGLAKQKTSAEIVSMASSMTRRTLAQGQCQSNRAEMSFFQESHSMLPHSNPLCCEAFAT